MSETDVVLIGGEGLRVGGSVEEVSSAITRGLDPERSGWVILELAGAERTAVRVRAAAIAYVREPAVAAAAVAGETHLRVAS